MICKRMPDGQWWASVTIEGHTFIGCGQTRHDAVNDLKRELQAVRARVMNLILSPNADDEDMHPDAVYARWWSKVNGL